ncbi:MAG: LysM peptidoglycan-binding domain-containing protein [Firmicutes bacterium]|nr:LysM peptidoglycan-binding domain-containing protein [Bacillota bacterium]
MALAIVLAFASPVSLASQMHTVRQGDTLYKISQAYGVSVSSIKQVNGLTSDVIYPGQTLVIPTSGGSQGGSAYTVRSGDTLYLIAQRHGVSVSALKSANGLSSDVIYVGQTLVIPSSNGGGQNGGQSSVHTVRSGESLYKIAQTYGVSVASLKQANNLKSDDIYPGQKLTIPKKESPGSAPSQSDRDLLARLVQAEAGAEPYTGKVAVAATVLNRVRSSAYPNTIPGVIYQVIDGKYYQYEPVLNGTINRPAGSEALKATDAALGGWDPSLGAIGFYNPAKTTNQWVRSRPVTVRIGNHVFFK